MKDCNLGDYLIYESQLVKCVAVNPGRKEVILETLEDEYCPHCKESLGKKQMGIIVSSPLFQNGAQPLQTINQDDKTLIIK